MGAAGVDFGGSVSLEGCSRHLTREPAVSISSSMVKSAHTLNLADNVEGFGGIDIAYPPFFDDSQWCIKLGCHIAGMCGYTDIGGYYYQVIQCFPFPVVAENEQSGEFVNGYIEEALDLGGVEVYSQ